jgi:hypothetical protein
VAAWFPDIFCYFNLVKNNQIANNSTTTEAREIIAQIWNPYKFFDACLTKFRNNQNLLNKISHKFLLTTKLFIGRKSLI